MSSAVDTLSERLENIAPLVTNASTSETIAPTAIRTPSAGRLEAWSWFLPAGNYQLSVSSGSTHDAEELCLDEPSRVYLALDLGFTPSGHSAELAEVAAESQLAFGLLWKVSIHADPQGFIAREHATNAAQV